jgi:hypothetical protein
MPAPTFRSLRSHPGRAVALALAALVGAGAVVAALGGTGPSGGPTRQASSSPEAVQDKASTAPGGGRYNADPNTSAALRPAGDAASADKAASGRGTPAPAPTLSGPMPPVSEAGSGATSRVGPDSLGGPPLPQAVAAGKSRIVKTAAVDLTVGKGKLADIEQQALDAVAAAGGWVQSSDMGAEQASLVLKVPSDRLEGVVSSLKKLGKVRSESMSGEDVTAQYVDLEARLTHWRAQEGVFLGLMARAKTIPETVQIQQQLSQIQEQIEQLEGQRRYLEGQTTFSTVRLGLVEAGAAAKLPEEASPSILAQAWERAAGAALAVLGGTLVVLGAAVPLAFILGIPVLVLLAALRRRSGVVVPPV